MLIKKELNKKRKFLSDIILKKRAVLIGTARFSFTLIYYKELLEEQIQYRCSIVVE